MHQTSGVNGLLVRAGAWLLPLLLAGSARAQPIPPAVEAGPASQPAATTQPASRPRAAPGATMRPAGPGAAQQSLAPRRHARPDTPDTPDTSGKPGRPGKPGKPSWPVEALYENGFKLRTLDRRSELKIGASTHLDTRLYAGSSVAPSAFDIRRARLDLQAVLFERLAIRIQAALEDNPYVRNALLDLTIWDALHLRVGQMKVPFSSLWLTQDNHVSFLERPAARPLYPFFDRGAMIWGSLLSGRVVYNVGIFTGAGVDLDATKGDPDTHKDLAWRLFLQPLRASGLRWLEGITLAGHGTWSYMAGPTRRFELGGLPTPNYESQVWRWRTEQILGTTGRHTDQIAAQIDTRTRWGAELVHLLGPLTLCAEWAMVRYEGIAIYHDFYQGARRLKHERLMERSGAVHNISAWVSWFITGESKVLENSGYKQPTPRRPLGWGTPGPGAWELLARFSGTFTDKQLFDQQAVTGYAAADFTDPDAALAGSAPGERAQVKAAVLEGAPTFYELTAGLSWTMNYNLRVQLNYVYVWAPDYAGGKDGIVSAGSSSLADTTIKNTIVGSEHMVGLRFIFRI